MALRSSRPHLVFVLLLAITLSFFPVTVEADSGVVLPTLDEFISTVSDGQAEALRGIYIPEVLAGSVVSQPSSDAAYVSSEANTLTQFGQAAQFGSIGLLAHNYLAGKTFSRVEEGQVVYLVYGDGHTQAFVVTQILRFQALDPDSIWSNFIDLDQGGRLSASRLFSKVYAQPGHLILQTCIYAHGDPSWGRLFVIAEPYPMKK